MFHCACFFVLLLSACAISSTQAESCAGYRKAVESDTESTDAKLLQVVDLNQDGLEDHIRAWAETGSMVELNCGDGTYYVPIRSHAHLWASPTGQGGWSDIRLVYPSPDTRTWIDGEFHLFNQLPLHSAAPETIPIRFVDGRYSADLKQCEALDLRAPLYEVAPPNLTRSPAPTHLTLVLGSGRYKIDRYEQTDYDFGIFTRKNINDDDIEDGALYYRERYGTGAREFSATLLGCGNGCYVYVPPNLKLLDLAD